jgi:hypothetical protein
VKLNAPVIIGVPLITPVEESNETPVGKDPAETLKAIGTVPPEVTIVSLIGDAIVQFGNVVVTGAKGGLIVTLYELLNDDPDASVALISKPNVLATDGVPVIAPVAPSNVNPSGNEPEETSNLIGTVPPEVLIVWLNGLSMVQLLSVVVAAVKGGLISTVYD